jgi:hypothetical protein
MNEEQTVRRGVTSRMRHAALPFAVAVHVFAVTFFIAAGCQTTAAAPSSTTTDAAAPPTTASAPLPGPASAQTTHAAAPVVDTRPIDAAALRPVIPAAWVSHARCDAHVHLRRAAPILFEDHVVSQLREVELEVQGPPGLRFRVEKSYAVDTVSLMPLVALRLPAGPATDNAAGASGALFDLGGLALAGLGNLLLLPVSLPLGLLVGNPDVFFFDAPTFTDGMFSDVVLDESAWQTEVQRRSAPHQDVLAQEAVRQKRFQTWLASLGLAQQQLSCTLDADGRCALRLLYPSSAVSVAFEGLPCALPPPAPDEPALDDTGADAPDEAQVPAKSKPTTAAKKTPQPSPPPETQWVTLPALPEPASPRVLELPPRDTDDRRGVGADRTAYAWRTERPRRDDASALFLNKQPHRGRRGQGVDDVTLACRVRAKGGGFDADGSAPELRARVAWGFDQDVVGFTFAGADNASEASGALGGVSMVPGELVKLSVVDVDALVDDWVGMDIVRFDGTWPLRFAHRRFVGECRVGADAGTDAAGDPDTGRSL